MPLKDRVLVVEDKKTYEKLLKTALISNGYDVISAGNSMDAYAMLTSYCPDIVLLDPDLPDADGIKIIKTVRQWSDIPIIVISSRNAEKEKVRALDLGADDYVTKPFGIAELMARVRTQLRHARARIGNEVMTGMETVRIGNLTVDMDKHCVFVDGVDAKLTENEFRIVSVLCRHAGKVISYDSIMKEVWGPGAGESTRILRVNMTNIRKKIEKDPSHPEYIFTQRGVGYRMLEVE